MTIATTLGHNLGGLIAHHPHLHRTRATVALPEPTSRPSRHGGEIELAVTHHRDDLDQWRAAFNFAAGFNR